MNQTSPTNQETEKNNQTSKKLNLPALIGWAVAILFMIAILFLINKNNDLNRHLELSKIQNEKVSTTNRGTSNENNEDSEMLKILRSKEIKVITLLGNQAVAPQAFAKVYLNRKENLAYVDVLGLPIPPDGNVYQFWSLQMEPFASKNIGILDETSRSSIGLYKFSNLSTLETLCITLEPSEGSIEPTMSKIYVLDMVR